MTSVKNNFKIVALAVAMLLTLGLIIEMPSLVKAATSYISIQASATATTTAVFLTAGTASTTYQIDNGSGTNQTKVFSMGEVDQLSLFLQMAASSSATVYQITPQYSNNNIDWYGYGQTIGTTNVATTSQTFYFIPGVTATTSQVFLLPSIPAAHERVIIGTSGANGAVYLEVVPKRLGTTP